MRNTGLKEAQAGIKISGRDINNLRYADDTTLMAESEEELKSLLKKVPLIFASLITACLSVFLLGSILVGTLCASWTWLTIYFPMLGMFSANYLLKYFVRSFISLFSFWDPYNVNGCVYNVVPGVS